ncbi:acyl CoA:acetate/3-ketoacid CoA transferase [Pasteurellaceae bacterium Pebbles2]|nr:acyl CoA:acetate/3-ketoacid CoA transferase [Pasteurellaceae bacterium Pebbles2]
MSFKFMNANEAANLIQDNQTICSVGMTLSGACESFLKALEHRFLSTGSPNNLTLVHSAGQSDRKDGLQHYAHEGFVTKIIGSHWGLQPKWMELISKNKVIAYCLPQGQIAHLYREMACASPGKFSKVGLGTFIDPRIEGGKMNERTKLMPDITNIITVDGEEYIHYKPIPLDVCIVRGTTADENGNISTEDEAMKLEILPAVLATKRYGGKVIVQVKRVAKAGALHPKSIVVPGNFVDAIVISEDPLRDHRQTSSWFYDPSYSGDLIVPEKKINISPLDIRKLIGRIGSRYLNIGDVINLGTGIPNDVIGKILQEEKLSKDIMVTVESGIYGGIQAGGVDFGIGQNLDAMITHHEQMDYYNGVGIDVTFMGLGELDESGNVNSTKMGDRCTGAGGFIDITQNAKKIIFLSQFTAKGLDIVCSDGKLSIIREGMIRKMVKKVSQISFNGELARNKGQQVYIATERAVFKLEREGVVLIEIAPGIDLEKDILNLMDFEPIISQDLKVMDHRLFIDQPFGLGNIIKNGGKINVE